MPFKPNYRLQRADRQRAKEEKQRKKSVRRAERDVSEPTDGPDVLGEDVSDGESRAGKAESPS
jgi:hypothetical protein